MVVHRHNENNISFIYANIVFAGTGDSMVWILITARAMILWTEFQTHILEIICHKNDQMQYLCILLSPTGLLSPKSGIRHLIVTIIVEWKRITLKVSEIDPRTFLFDRCCKAPTPLAQETWCVFWIMFVTAQGCCTILWSLMIYFHNLISFDKPSYKDRLHQLWQYILQLISNHYWCEFDRLFQPTHFVALIVNIALLY